MDSDSIMVTQLMPPEILLKIFSKVPFRELLNCSETCKLWNALIKTKIFPKRSIAMTAYNCEQFAILRSILNSPLSTFQGGIIIRYPSHSNDPFDRTFREEIMDQSYSVPYVPEPHGTMAQGKDFHLSDIKCFDGLSHIRLEYIKDCQIMESDLISALNSCTHLSSLSLERSNIRFTSSGLAKLTPLKDLVYLNLSGLETLSDTVFSEMVKKVPNLKILILAFCKINHPPIERKTYLTQDSVLDACKNLPLKELSLRNGGINDKFLGDLGVSVKLDKLDIAFCSSITLPGLLQFFKGHSHRLKSINLTSCRKIFTDYVPNESNPLDFLSSLTEINLSLLSFHLKGFPCIMKQLNSLHKLILNDIDVPNVFIVNSFMEISRSITHLEVRGCYISVENAKHLATFPGLQALTCSIESVDVFHILACSVNMRQNLVKLDLSSNYLHFDLQLFEFFENLENLSMHKSALSLGPSYQFCFRKLKELTINNCHLFPIEKIHYLWIRFSNLETLTLVGLNQITNTVLENIIYSFDFLTSIKIVSLCNINKDGFINIRKAKRLRAIHVCHVLFDELFNDLMIQSNLPKLQLYLHSNDL